MASHPAARFTGRAPQACGPGAQTSGPGPGARLALAFLLALPGLVVLPGPSGQARAGAIYSYTDDQGVFTLTNRRLNPRVRHQVFLVFRDYPVERRPELAGLIRQYSRQYGLDESLVSAVVQVESGFNPLAVSPAGAQGAMQIMPATQRDLGVTRPFDPAQSIEAGVRYLKEQMDAFGTTELALAAYNAGPESVRRHRGVPPFAETRAYVRKVLSLSQSR